MGFLVYLSNLGMGGGGSVAPVVTGQTPAGNPAKGSGPAKRRWCRIGDRLYHATQDECSELLDAYVARQEGKEVELPPVRSKLDRKRRVTVNIDVTPPAIAYKGFDWQAEYVKYMRALDDYMAAMLAEAVRRRSDDDEEDAIVLLLH